MNTEDTPERTTPTIRKLILKAALLDQIPLSFPTIWQKMRRGEFPLPVKLGNGPTAKSAWFEDEIQDYQRNLPRVELKPLTEAEAEVRTKTDSDPAIARIGHNQPPSP